MSWLDGVVEVDTIGLEASFSMVERVYMIPSNGGGMIGGEFEYTPRRS